MTSKESGKGHDAGSRTLPYAGRFVWRDLMSTDPEASKSFYTQLFGWGTKEQDMGPEIGTYTMWTVGGCDIGGLVPLDPSHEMPSHWISYVTVEDVEAAAVKAKELGGDAPVPATDIPGVGRFAVILDPQGGAISPFRFEERDGEGGMPPEDEGAPPVGQFCWHQINARDLASAAEFYTGVFGWGTEVTSMEGVGPYHLFRRGSQEVASGMQIPKEVEAPSHWLGYVRVEDAAATVSRARELGGQVHVEATDMPGLGRFAVLADPTGAGFAVFEFHQA